MRNQHVPKCERTEKCRFSTSVVTSSKPKDPYRVLREIMSHCRTLNCESYTPIPACGYRPSLTPIKLKVKGTRYETFRDIL